MTDYLETIRERLPVPGNFDEVFAFSVHKAGSSLLHKMMAEVCQAASIPAVSIPDILFVEGVGDDWQRDAEMIGHFGPGRVYFGFRELPPFMNDPRFDLSVKRSVLLVRDPRDALVSQFFSMGGRYISHKLPSKNQEAFLSRLKTTAHLEIDEYVLKTSRNYRAKLTAYADALNPELTLQRRYEDIYYDKVTFLIEIFDHFRLDVDHRILREVALRNDVRPATEQVDQHIRKGQPGDHREKLRAETIEQLNEVFRDTCAHFGYDADGFR